MADKDHTRPRGRLEQAIESERARLLQASAVLKCLYEVLLYADGDDAVTFADAAHVAATLVENAVDKLDSVRLRPLIDDLQRGGSYKVEDVRAVYVN